MLGRGYLSRDWDVVDFERFSQWESKGKMARVPYIRTKLESRYWNSNLRHSYHYLKP